jgi:hypothetical protein
MEEVQGLSPCSSTKYVSFTPRPEITSPDVVSYSGRSDGPYVAADFVNTITRTIEATCAVDFQGNRKCP